MEPKGVYILYVYKYFSLKLFYFCILYMSESKSMCVKFCNISAGKQCHSFASSITNIVQLLCSPVITLGWAVEQGPMQGNIHNRIVDLIFFALARGLWALLFLLEIPISAILHLKNPYSIVFTVFACINSSLQIQNVRILGCNPKCIYKSGKTHWTLWVPMRHTLVWGCIFFKGCFPKNASSDGISR